MQKNERFRPKPVNKYAFIIDREKLKEEELDNPTQLIPGTF
jgi:hypothetical protein